ncbi:molecular chaperone DnaJ [Candidatus Woesearchaeota archaeon]|nr:molecular chaperone DnaJ [Candidatus Woesearchaeota archaeon]
MAKEYYKTLGVPQNATKEEIKQAYKRLAKQYHPDINKDPEASEKFKEISEAAAILGDDKKREQYDNFGTTQGQNFEGFDFSGFGSFDDIVENMFSGFGFNFGGRKNRGEHGADLQAEVEITLKEVSTGTTRAVKTNAQVQCNVCHGKGGTGEHECSECNGNGYVKHARRTPFGVFATQTNCPRCHGQGQEFEKSCNECKGQGRIRKSKEIVVEIPAGIEDGMRLRVSGQGEAGTKGGRTGDLFVFVHVKKDLRFERNGQDLYTEIATPFHILCLGGVLEVQGLDASFSLKIPAGTKDNTQFRFEDKGLPNLRGGHGDLIVKTYVDIPNKLSKEQKDSLKAFGAKEKKGWLF